MKLYNQTWSEPTLLEIYALLTDCITFINVSSTQCFDVEHDFSCGCFWKVFNNRIQQKWSKLTLAFVLFYFLSIIFLFLYSFFLTNWHKLYQWLHKARQEVFISISFGTGWFPTLGLRDISTSPYGVVLETVQGKTTSFIYRALFNWIQTFLRRQKTLRILESTFSNNLRYIENIYFFVTYNKKCKTKIHFLENQKKRFGRFTIKECGD